jgi:hypothetical protein
MTGQDGGFPQAAARFSAEVDSALTRARRAAAEARALSADFRRGTGELAGQAKAGRLRGIRRDDVTPTSADARQQAVEFRTANGLAVEELPDAGALVARMPGAGPETPPAVDDEDFSQHLVLVDVAEQEQPEHLEHLEPEPDGTGAPEPETTRASDDDEDFSQQRILMDATVDSYRPDGMPDATFMPSDQEEAGQKLRPGLDLG